MINRVCLVLAMALWAGLAQAEETILRRGNAAEPGTLDPQRWETTNELAILGDLYEGLTATGPGGHVQAGQAAGWTVSPDGLVWRFSLRPGLVWSNGDPITAADFVYSFRRLVDPATASPTAFLAEPIVGASEILRGQEHDPTRLGVSAPDPGTVLITLRAPNAALPAMLAQLRPVHRGSVESDGKEAFRPGHLVSNGAYQLLEWAPQSRVVLGRNPRYYDNAKTQIDRVEFYPTENPSEELKRYRAGDLDLTFSVPHDQHALIQESLKAEYHSAPRLALFYVGFNVDLPPFKDSPALRRALSLAIDRKILTEKIVGGGSQPAYSLVPPHLLDYQPPEFAWRDLDPAARQALARAAYAEAGYSAGHPLVVDLVYNTSDDNRQVMVAVAAMWKQVLGVQTHLTNQEFKTLLVALRQRKTDQAFRAGFLGFYDDPAPLLEIVRPDAYYNFSGYSNPQFEIEFRAGLESIAPPERARHLAAAEALALDDMPIAPLFTQAAEHMIKPYVTGWQPSPRDSFRSQDLKVSR